MFLKGELALEKSLTTADFKGELTSNLAVKKLRVFKFLIKFPTLISHFIIRSNNRTDYSNAFEMSRYESEL